ncbi:MAG: alginate export family protein [Planctomycetota bacterium]
MGARTRFVTAPLGGRLAIVCLVSLVGFVTIGLDLAAGQEELSPGTRVEVDGLWTEGVLVATKVVIEQPDPYPEVKGLPTSIDLEKREIVIGPFVVEVMDRTDIEDDEAGDESFDLEELRPEWRLKAEGEITEPGRMRAVTIDVVRKSKKGETLELEGEVEEERFEDDGSHIIVVLGVPCRIGEGIEAVRKKPKPAAGKATRRIDEEEERPKDQLVLFDRLIIGGEVQIDVDYRDNYDLDDGSDRDTLVLDTSAVLEGQVYLGRSAYAFVKGRSTKSYVLFDQDRDLLLGEKTSLQELNVFWNRPFDWPFALLVGRQDFDDAREWVYDQNLDGVRLFWYPRLDLEVEYSLSTILRGGRREFEDRRNQAFWLRWHHARKSYLGVYIYDIVDTSSSDDSPFYLGLRAVGEPTRSILYWLDYSYLDGINDTLDREAHAADLGGGYQFRDLPFRPYLYGGYAFATGDSRAGGRTDRSYTQTGYADNNDKFFGVASFRYYGEMFRPELSNLHVFTSGAGIRPVKWFSVDAIYHHYTQHHGAATLAKSRLRSSPGGNSREIGREFDLVIGVEKLLRRFDVEVDIGYFMPGRAFEVDDDPALWVQVQVEWNF